MVVLTFHVGASTYFNTSKCSHASLHPDKAGSCKQHFGHVCINREINTKSCERTDQARNIQYYHDVILAVPSAILNCSAHSGRLDNHVLPADIICRYLLIYYNICPAPIEIDVPMIGACGILFCDWASVVNKPYATQANIDKVRSRLDHNATPGTTACRTRELSAELTVTRRYWRKQNPPVCGEILTVFCHACQKSFKILPHTGGFAYANVHE